MVGNVEIRILGPLSASLGGSDLGLGGTKQKTVLAMLLLSPNEIVSVGRLIEAVWGPDAAPSAARTLQVYLSKLRGILNPSRDPNLEIIETAPPGYRCSVDINTLDLLRFESLVDRGRVHASRGDAADAIESYREALGLWHGYALADLIEHSRTVESEAERLELARLAVTADLMDAELAVGRHSRILPDLERLVRHHPLDERFRGQQMIALYRSGRHADALASYKQMRMLLSSELGLEPGTELKQLEDQILMHDSELMRIEVAPPGTTTTINRGGESGPDAWLEGSNGPIKLDRAVTTIGRLTDRSIVLDDHTVSRRHAEIRKVGARFALVDVGSTNGVNVNGRQVLEHDLTDGDEVWFGASRFVFHAESD